MFNTNDKKTKNIKDNFKFQWKNVSKSFEDKGDNLTT